MAAPEVLEVRCAGCGETLEVEQGMTEFACPGCATPQALPPELMPPPRPRRALPLHHGRGGGGTGNQMTCGGCGAVLGVPWGLRRITCPLCASDLAVDGDCLRPCYAGVQVVSPPGAASRAPSSLCRPEVLGSRLLYFPFQ
jgi:LSD1 subclass zinc finger protein